MTHPLKPVHPAAVDIGDLIFQGAESKVYHCTFYGQAGVCKHRFAKRYRHPELDEKLRNQRTRHEARALERCLVKGIRVPHLYGVDHREARLFMEVVTGKTIKDALDVDNAASQARAKPGVATASSPTALALLRAMGMTVAKLHNANVIHGDLTTSNFMTTFDATAEGNGSGSQRAAAASSAATSPAPSSLPSVADIVVIDFGLIAEKFNAEECAVDLYVLERALTATHPYLGHGAVEVVLSGYRSVMDPKMAGTVLTRLEAVRARGRKRSMVG